MRIIWQILLILVKFLSNNPNNSYNFRFWLKIQKIHTIIRFVYTSYGLGRCPELRICSLNLQNFLRGSHNPARVHMRRLARISAGNTGYWLTQPGNAGMQRLNRKITRHRLSYTTKGTTVTGTSRKGGPNHVLKKNTTHYLTCIGHTLNTYPPNQWQSPRRPQQKKSKKKHAFSLNTMQQLIFCAEQMP